MHLRRVAAAATSNCHQIFPVLQLLARCRTIHRSRHRLGRASDQIIDRELDFRPRKWVPDRGQRTQIHHNRSEIFIRHVLVSAIRHNGKNHAAIVSDSLTDRARQLVISPAAGSGLHIRRDVGCHHSPRQSGKGEILSTEFIPCYNWSAVGFPIPDGMAARTV